MRRSSRKEKITYILAGAAFVLVALALLVLLVLNPSKAKKEAEEAPSATAEPSATAAPISDGITIAGKLVDKETDSFDLGGVPLSEEDRAAIGTLHNLTTLSLTK